MKTKLALALACIAAVLIGCVSARVSETKTSVDKNGQTNMVTKSIGVSSFLSSIKNGKYTATNSDGTSQTLSTDEATPDQQSIAILAGGVVDLAKAGMLMSKPPTNSTPDTNAPAR